MEHLIKPLIDNSKSAMLSCVEMHNKPMFPYRYQVCSILSINSWELLLKAYIFQNHPEVNIILEDGTTKQFEECLRCVSSNVGKSFRAAEENISKLYEFRCNMIHFYEENISPLLFSLLYKNVLFYNEFLKTHFNIDLSEETNLMLLPIGFKPMATPVDFLRPESELAESSPAIQDFIKSIIKSTEQLHSEEIEEPILMGFKMAVINENRIKNADIVAAISKDGSKAKVAVENVLGHVKITDSETAKKVSINEESLFKTIYILNHYSVVKRARELFKNFKQNQEFNKIMQSVKNNPTYHKYRYLNMIEQKGMGQDWYTSAVFDELSTHYEKKEEEKAVANNT